LQVGTVWGNDPVADNLAAPLGGMRASGNASELGPEGLDSLTRPRRVYWNLDLVRKESRLREERERRAAKEMLPGHGSSELPRCWSMACPASSATGAMPTPSSSRGERAGI